MPHQEHIEVKIKAEEGVILPEYQTEGSAGMDLRAFIDEPITLAPLQRMLIPTGLSVELPLGYEIQVRPRSGLSINKGITLINTPGTIDSDYRGTIGIGLINLSGEDFTINNGDRLAQAILQRVERMELIKVDFIDQNTGRGTGGYGSTGVK